jgi:hypothetical protein
MSDRFDELISTTLKNYVSTQLEDNVFDDLPFFYWADKRGDGLKETQDGGESIIVPLLYAANSTAKSYSGYDLLDTTPQGGIGSATYPWKQYAVSITIDRLSERKNSGKHQIINLLNAKIKQAEMSLRDIFSQHLFSDGTGNEAKNVLGLAAIVDPTPATGTVGGIDASAYTWWRNYQVAGTQSAAAFDRLKTRMGTAYNTVSKGKDHPDFMVTDQTVFEGWEGLLTTTINYQIGLTDTKLADFGFENYKFKGARLVFDNDCTASAMYVLNSKYLKLYVDDQTDFITSPFVRPANQDAKTAQILWMGQLCCSNRSRHGVITAIT